MFDNIFTLNYAYGFDSIFAINISRVKYICRVIPNNLAFTWDGDRLKFFAVTLSMYDEALSIKNKIRLAVHVALDTH